MKFAAGNTSNNIHPAQPHVEDNDMNSPMMPKFSKARRPSGLPRKFRIQPASSQTEILLVHDGSNLFPKIGTILQNQGFQVVIAPDAQTALEELINYDFAAVIAGASREQSAGLQVLAAVKEIRPEIKTMVVTRLLNPELPVEAYEMDIDDYIHWPLSSSELSGRIKSLLPDGRGGAVSDSGVTDYEPNNFNLAAMGSLVAGFTNSLALISQSLEDIRQEHREGMAENLSADLGDIALQIDQLGENLRRCWNFGKIPDSAASAPNSRFH
jgi:DNA-binding response OmpR family regulator